jgi:hypothetical protein
MAHTPGPWDLLLRADGSRIRLNGSTVYQVSDVTDPDFPSGTPRSCLDDLRLMAAAPELLAALKDHIPWKNAGLPEKPPQGWGIWQNAIDAINKAEGRSY